MATETFTYTPETGEPITAPAFDQAMSAGFLRKHRKDSEVEQMFALVEHALDAENLDRFDGLALEQMNAFYTQWQEAAGITAGE